MLTRTLLLSFLFSIGFSKLFAQVPDYGVKMDTGQVEPNQIVCRPVIAKGFSNIVSFQYVHHWDAAVLQYHSFEYINLTSVEQNDHTLISPNSLVIAWAEALGLGLSVPDGQVMYKICFTAIAPIGSFSTIYADGIGLPLSAGGAEAYNNTFQNVWNSNHNEPGLVQVVETSSTETPEDAAKHAFELSPNPTQNTAQIRFQATTSGTTILSITDASGRRVLEEKIPHTAGENLYQIPEKILTSKGLYQVSLQQGKAISTQTLSVF